MSSLLFTAIWKKRAYLRHGFNTGKTIALLEEPAGRSWNLPAFTETMTTALSNWSCLIREGSQSYGWRHFPCSASVPWSESRPPSLPLPASVPWAERIDSA